MGSPPLEVIEIFRSFLARVDKGVGFDRDTTLLSDGVGLDSLEIAELAAVLEDEYGTDPFSADTMPNTVGDILDYYDTDYHDSAVWKG